MAKLSRRFSKFIYYHSVHCDVTQSTLVDINMTLLLCFFIYISDLQVLKGNIDSQNISRRRLSPGIPSVESIRFIPVAKSARSVCARLEIYGCQMPSKAIYHNFWSIAPSSDIWIYKKSWAHFFHGTRDARLSNTLLVHRQHSEYPVASVNPQRGERGGKLFPLHHSRLQQRTLVG